MSTSTSKQEYYKFPFCKKPGSRKLIFLSSKWAVLILHQRFLIDRVYPIQSHRYSFHTCSLCIKQRKSPIAGLWSSVWAQPQKGSVTLQHGSSSTVNINIRYKLHSYFLDLPKHANIMNWYKNKADTLNPDATHPRCIIQEECNRYPVTHRSQQKSSEHQKSSKQVYRAGYQVNQPKCKAYIQVILWISECRMGPI